MAGDDKGDIEMSNVFEEYVDKFHDNFPIFAPMPEGKTCEEVAKECLKTGKPFKPDYKDGMVY